MNPYGQRWTVYLDEKGEPFQRPEQPPSGAPIEDVIAWMRAAADYNDAIAACGARAFDRAFRVAVDG